MHAGFPCALEIIKIIPKTTHESCQREKKTGVELTMMTSNRNQEVGIIAENISMLLYTLFVMTVGVGF